MNMSRRVSRSEPRKGSIRGKPSIAWISDFSDVQPAFGTSQ
jgi:hypothetical protein